MSRKSKNFKFLISIILCEAFGNLGSFFTFPKLGTWYTQILKPDFNPPNFIFGPVWTTLFLLMGIALYLLWEKGFNTKESKIAGIFFFIQFILNILWSFLFFGLESPLYGFIDIILLLIFIAITILLFHKISKKASYLLIPYFLWVGFATILNYGILFLNSKC